MKRSGNFLTSQQSRRDALNCTKRQKVFPQEGGFDARWTWHRRTKFEQEENYQ